MYDCMNACPIFHSLPPTHLLSRAGGSSDRLAPPDEASRLRLEEKEVTRSPMAWHWPPAEHPCFAYLQSIPASPTCSEILARPCHAAAMTGV